MVDPLSQPSSSKKRASRRRRPRHKQNFSSYLNFGVSSTACACCFLLVYVLLFIGLMPLLSPGGKSITDESNSHMKHHIPLEKLAPLAEKEQQIVGKMAKNLRQKLQNFRDSRGFTDHDLQRAAIEEFKPLRARQKEANAEKAAQKAVVKDQVAPVPGRRPGFLVLGMHRSGTSMLSGLLNQGCGYNVGGPLIGAHFDNQKGFFERIDAVLQNDEFMKDQRVWWSSGVISYDSDKALDHLKKGTIPFVEGKKALEFFDNPNNTPWMQKDPRMCITVKTWLKLMKHEPAVLFTYRHPLEVALSLQSREKFSLDHGLRLWIVYNMRAIQNTAGMCRVFSSNDAILANPLLEVQRLSAELTSTCGVPEAPSTISQEDVDKFVDPNMQHGKKKLGEGKETLEEIDGCVIPEFDSDHEKDTPSWKRERELYKIAMEIHCDFKSGKAYEDSYKWPEIPQ